MKWVNRGARGACEGLWWPWALGVLASCASAEREPKPAPPAGAQSRLQQERAQRPATAWPVERLWQQLRAAELPLTEPYPRLASVQYAQYCEGATLGARVQLIACEHADPAAAGAALARLEIPNVRQTVWRGATSLTALSPPGAEGERAALEQSLALWRAPAP